MPNTNNKDHNWQESWPKGNEFELLFRYIAFLRKEELNKEYQELMAEDVEMAPTPQLDATIAKLIRKGRRMALRRKITKHWRKAAAVAMIAIVLSLATPTVLFAASASFRQIVYNYILEWNEDYVAVSVDQSQNNPDASDILGYDVDQGFTKYYLPAYIPAGFELTSIIDDKNEFSLDYQQGEQYIYFFTQPLDLQRLIDTTDADYSFSEKINDWPAIISQKDGLIKIYWNDYVTDFTLQTNLPMSEALAIARSVTWQERYP